MNFQHVPNMAQLRIGNFYVDKNGFLRIQQDATLQPGCSSGIFLSFEFLFSFKKSQLCMHRHIFYITISDFAHSEVNVPNEDRQVEASNVEIFVDLCIFP